MEIERAFHVRPALAFLLRTRGAGPEVNLELYFGNLWAHRLNIGKFAEFAAAHNGAGRERQMTSDDFSGGARGELNSKRDRRRRRWKNCRIMQKLYMYARGCGVGIDEAILGFSNFSSYTGCAQLMERGYSGARSDILPGRWSCGEKNFR